VQEDIETTVRTITELKQQEKNAKLRQWRADMKDVGKVGRWLKRRLAPPAGSTILHRKGVQAENSQQALDFIAEHWKDIDKEALKGDSLDTAASHMVDMFGSGLAPHHGPDDAGDGGDDLEHIAPSIDDLLAWAASATGAAGPDGWSAAELRHLPRDAWALFRVIALSWTHHGRAPRDLHLSRQVSLVKPGKAKDGLVDTGDLRPITVMSTFWRCWASAWARGRFVEGLRERLPGEVKGGKGECCEDLMSDLLDEFYMNTDAVALSMDFSQCYDRMAPKSRLHS
jgi:hypothetical protein